MKVINLGNASSALNTFVAEMRDAAVQTDSMRFRRNLERISEMMAYEISKTMDSRHITVQTPLGIAEMDVPAEEVIIASILRAALPMHQGMLGCFDRAQNAFIAAYRKYGKDNKFTISFEYMSSPSTEGKTVILCDPMLATGSSLCLAYKALESRGLPAKTHIVSIVASRDGIAHLKKNLGIHKNLTLWICGLDDEMTVKSYIVPGLGDAGDLAFGMKL
ncbi:MAG: uracil phosphoribosyltransferase [Prevotellaceae bacterium]|jgi:uracil phosphoribosyltransferase|nr:uracil phosphoribosyltransferase [Prevotellaceae bacterium]